MFTFVGTIALGPNNAMVLSSGVNLGFGRTRVYVFGVTIGFTVMISAVGLGRVFSLFRCFTRFYVPPASDR